MKLLHKIDAIEFWKLETGKELRREARLMSNCLDGVLYRQLIRRPDYALVSVRAGSVPILGMEFFCDKLTEILGFDNSVFKWESEDGIENPLAAVVRSFMEVTGRTTGDSDVDRALSAVVTAEQLLIHAMNVTFGEDGLPLLRDLRAANFVPFSASTKIALDVVMSLARNTTNTDVRHNLVPSHLWETVEPESALASVFSSVDYSKIEERMLAGGDIWSHEFDRYIYRPYQYVTVIAALTEPVVVRMNETEPGVTWIGGDWGLKETDK